MVNQSRINCHHQSPKCSSFLENQVLFLLANRFLYLLNHEISSFNSDSLFLFQVLLLLLNFYLKFRICPDVVKIIAYYYSFIFRTSRLRITFNFIIIFLLNINCQLLLISAVFESLSLINRIKLKMVIAFIILWI